MRGALLAAVAASLGYGVASVLQAAGAARVQPAGDGIATVLRSPLYLLGLLADLVAWLLSVVALRRVPLFVVQPILAASLAVTVLLARRVLGTAMRPREVAAVVGVVVASGVLASSAGLGRVRPPGTVAIVVVCVAVVAVAGACAAAWRSGHSVVLALLAGTAYGLGAIGARVLRPAPPGVPLLSGAGIAYLAAQPMVWVVVVGNVVGTLVYARSLQRGAVGPAAASLWVAEVVVPGAVGVLALGDTVRAGWAAPAAVGVAVVIASVLVLAWAPATAATADVPADPPADAPADPPTRPVSGPGLGP